MKRDSQQENWDPDPVSLAGTWVWTIWSCRFYTLKTIKVKVAQSCLTLCGPRTVQSMEFLRPEPEWGAFPFSRWSSQPRDWTQVSHMEGGFFASWTTGESKNSQTLAISCRSIQQSRYTCCNMDFKFSFPSVLTSVRREQVVGVEN